VIAIETAGPERLTFVHQIDTMELPTSHRGSARGKEMSHVWFTQDIYLPPARVSRGSRVVADG